MNEEPPRKPDKRDDIGVRFEKKIIFHTQYEFDKYRGQLRWESDMNIVRNGLFDLVNWLAAILLAKLKDEATVKDVEGLLEELDSDDMSPKTEIEVMEPHLISLIYDSVSAECPPEQLPDVLRQVNLERVEVTVRKLWGKLRKLQIIAYRENIFHERYEIKFDKKDQVIDRA